MRCRAWIIAASSAIAIAASRARADEPPGVEARSELVQPGPRLEIDPVLQPRLEGLGAVEVTERRQLRIDPRTSLVIEGVIWSIDDAAPEPHVDLPGQGWRATVRLSRELGLVRLGASASLNEIDTRFGRGRYVDVGLSVGRILRLSRWRTAWISLGLGRRRWLGTEPPAGEQDGIQLMLTIGTTFR